MFSLFNFIEVPVATNFFNAHLDFSQQALAKSRGGRSGGGSFKSRSRSTSSSSRSKTQTSKYNDRKTSSYTDNRVIIQNNNSSYRSYSYGNRGGSSLLFLLTFFSFFGFIAYLFYAQSKAEQKRAIKKQTDLENEAENCKVTISKLQVALTGEAKIIAKQLSELSLSVDTNAKEGLLKLLQESIIILLRNQDYWTHVLSRSFPVKIDKAEAAFNRLSIAERSKFSAELSNFNGRISNPETYVSENNQQVENSLFSYFVVTILVGSTDEQALFHQLHSIEELKLALEKLAILDEDNLLKLEILWTPQSENEFLTNDEFIMEYTDMIQLV